MMIRSVHCSSKSLVYFATRAAYSSVSLGRSSSWTREDGSSVPGISFGSIENPGVIVLQEWWGITDEIKIQANNIAQAGFHALVPDLYRGKIGVEAEEAEHLMTNLDWAGAVEDIRGAANYLQQVSGGKKVGCTGFCMGGALTIAGATRIENIACGAVFYGVCPKELADPANCTVPMQAHFGEKDMLVGFSDPVTANALEESFKKAGIEYEFYRYPGVAHGFMNDTDYAIERSKKLGFTGGDTGANFDSKAIALAYERLFAFFKKHL